MNEWHVITKGYLTRNKFWGEDEYKIYRPVIATSTVIQSQYGNILVDPSMNAKEMQEAVYNSCGLKPENIDIIYSTHFHNDHWMGLDGFPNAKIYMAKGDFDGLQTLRDCVPESMAKMIDKVQPAEGELVPGFKLIPLPGHTAGLQGLLFDAPEGRVLVAGDAVMGYEYFRAKEGYFYSLSLEKCAQSIQKAAELADVIVPGHGNCFNVKAYPFEPQNIDVPDRFADIKPNGKYSADTTIGEILEIKDSTKLFDEHFVPGLPLVALKMSSYIPIKIFAKSMGISKEKFQSFINAL